MLPAGGPELFSGQVCRKTNSGSTLHNAHPHHPPPSFTCLLCHPERSEGSIPDAPPPRIPNPESKKRQYRREPPFRNQGSGRFPPFSAPTQAGSGPNPSRHGHGDDQPGQDLAPAPGRYSLRDDQPGQHLAPAPGARQRCGRLPGEGLAAAPAKEDSSVPDSWKSGNFCNKLLWKNVEPAIEIP